jgi:hypothetical protein
MAGNTTTKAKVKAYESTSHVFESLYKEIRELGKSKREATLNPGKVALINRLLEDLKGFLVDEPDSKYLDLLDDADLPQYSDAVLVLSQFSAALDRFHDQYYREDDFTGDFRWHTKG